MHTRTGVLLLCLAIAGLGIYLRTLWGPSSSPSSSPPPSPPASNTMSSSAPALEFLTVPATTAHTATVMFVHGLGDSGHGLRDAATFLRDRHPHIQFLLPHAPVRAITAMNKQQMPAWYDIKTFPMPLMGGGEDMAGLLASRAAIQQLVDSDSDRGRTVLMGFSQGGAMTYLTGLTTAERAENGGEKGKGGRYAGLALFGSRIYAVDFIRQNVSKDVQELPIFVAHGKDDKTVPYEYCEHSLHFLEEELGIEEAQELGGKGVAFKAYPGLGHTVAREQLEDLSMWLAKVLPP